MHYKRHTGGITHGPSYQQNRERRQHYRWCPGQAWAVYLNKQKRCVFTSALCRLNFLAVVILVVLLHVFEPLAVHPFE